MMQNLYDLERIYELEQFDREMQRRRHQGESAWRSRGEGVGAWLAGVAALLAFLRLG